MVDPDLLARKAALDSAELRGQGIRDTVAVLSAIENTPREVFVPEVLRQHAYDNVSRADQSGPDDQPALYRRHDDRRA